MRYLLSLLFLFGIYAQTSAQNNNKPTSWSFSAKPIKGNNYQLRVECKLKPHWHIWSMNVGGDGLMFPPNIVFTPSKDYQLVGKMKEEGKRISKEFIKGEPLFNYYENKVTFVQEAKINKATNIQGKYSYQVCDTSKCDLPVENVPFQIKISDVASVDSPSNGSNIASTDTAPTTEVNSVDVTKIDSPTIAAAAPEPTQAPTESATSVSDTKGKSEQLGDLSKLSMWQILLIAFLAGLAAVTTPCIYSMVPLTVSLFTKQNNDRKEGIRKAIFYAISIVVIFAVLGMAITAIWGSDGLYKISTNWIANLFFFILFVIFGISFLGAFEIKLPASWSTAADKKSNAGSYLGIFFMALTLVIVSFSCTSAFIGGIAVLASRGSFLGPLLGFGAFGLGLGLPFAFFAMFPGYLKNLEKPGGWQNALKVTLGFLELGLAMKFLSNADLAKGWRLLDREIFIAIWIVMAILLGLYLLGKIRFFNDSELKKNYFDIPYVSTFRLFLAGASFTFAVILMPGLIGAPLNGLSAFLPPMGTQTFVLQSGGAPSASTSSKESEDDVKYKSQLKIYEPATVTNLGLHTYFDYNQAKEASKKEHKPLMLDFTGITCINCRRMESEVWSSPEVLKRLKDDFIVVSLYCDANTVQTDYKDEAGEALTLGQFNLNLQKNKFNSASQPLYFYIDDKENILASEGYPYKSDVQAFVDHLEKVKAKYKELNP